MNLLIKRVSALGGALFLFAACEALNFSNPDDPPADSNSKVQPVTPPKPDADADVFIVYAAPPDNPFTAVSVRYAAKPGYALDIKADAFTIPAEDRDNMIFSFSFIPGGEMVIVGRRADEKINLRFSQAKKLTLRGLDMDGSPVPGRPIPIGSYAEFTKIRECLDNEAFNAPSVTFRQEADIHLWGDEMYKSARFFRPWTPFGYKSGEPPVPDPTPFSATYDGNGKRLLSLRIETDQNRQGLFAAIGQDGVVKNVRLQDAFMETGNESGIICAVNEGNIENYAVSGAVKKASKQTSGKTLGGVCGINEAGGNIIAGYFYGDVDALDESGGICGDNRGYISAGFHYGSVADKSAVPPTPPAGGLHHIAGLLGGGGNLNFCYWFAPDPSAPPDGQTAPFSAGHWPSLFDADPSLPWAAYKDYGTGVKSGRWKSAGAASDAPAFADVPKLWYE